MHTQNSFVMLVATVLFLAVGGVTQAETILYEPFDYGPVADILAGKSGATEVGLAGTWNAGRKVGDDGAYDPVSLAFGNLQTTGGKGGLTPGGNVIERALGTTGSGTLYFGFLTRFDKEGDPLHDDTESGILISEDWDLENNAYHQRSDWAMQLRKWRGGGLGHIDVDGDRTSGSVVLEGTPIESNTTYLALYQLDNVAPTDDPPASLQTLTGWILTEAQYANFKPGGLTTDELNAATLGPGATQVLQRGSKSGTSSDHPATFGMTGDSSDPAYPAWNKGPDYLILNGTKEGTHYWDELRVSNLSLDEVAPAVPEPGTLIMLAGGLLGLALLAWRQRR